MRSMRTHSKQEGVMHSITMNFSKNLSQINVETDEVGNVAIIADIHNKGMN